MKKLFLLTFLFSVFTTSAQTTTTDVTVTITNIPGNEGKVIVSLHNEASFMKTDPLQKEVSLIEDGKATVTFKDVPIGEYGVICFHDKNDNDKIDMAPTGMPTEAYGVSNNPMSFGPPQWSEAKFTVIEEPVEMEIRF